jgi:hypothetical protein
MLHLQGKVVARRLGGLTMRTIEEIKDEIELLVRRNADKMHEEIYRCQVELAQVITKDITLERLEAICQAEREGRCFSFPVKIGTELWHIYEQENGPKRCYASEDNIFLISKRIGKTVFLTEAEAREALGGAEDGN